MKTSNIIAILLLIVLALFGPGLLEKTNTPTNIYNAYYKMKTESVQYEIDSNMQILKSMYNNASQAKKNEFKEYSNGVLDGLKTAESQFISEVKEVENTFKYVIDAIPVINNYEKKLKTINSAVIQELKSVKID